MNLIDDKGRIFGIVNIIDALVVLLVLAVTAAGTAFVLGGDDYLGQTSIDDQPTNATTAIAFKATDVQPFVADAIPTGPVPTDAVTAVENKSVRPTRVVVEAENGTLHERPHPQKRTVTLELTLNATRTDDELTFDGGPLEVGRSLTLDLGNVTINGTVTNVGRQ